MSLVVYLLPRKRELRMPRPALREIGAHAEGRVLSGEMSLNRRWAEEERAVRTRREYVESGNATASLSPTGHLIRDAE